MSIECGKFLKIQDWLDGLCSLELYELIYIFIEMLHISSFYLTLLLASFLKFRVSLVIGLHASNISIFYDNFNFPPPANKKE